MTVLHAMVSTRFLLAALVAASAFFSAGAVHAVVLRPDANSAVLTGVDHSYAAIVIAKLDGKSLGTGFLKARLPSQVRLTPGRHTVALRLESGGILPAILWLDAVAGREYIAKFKMEAQGTRVWLEDAKSHVEVGGIADGGAAPVANAPEIHVSVPAATDGTTATMAPDPSDSPEQQRQVRITWFDGNPRFHPTDLYRGLRFAPGMHRIVVHHQVGGFEGWIGLRFEARAGHAYWIRQRVDGYSSEVWIEDATDGSRVSELFKIDSYSHKPLQ